MKVEVPQNCKPDQCLSRGKKYPATVIWWAPAAESCGRCFAITVSKNFRPVLINEFNSIQISGGDWIVHEDVE